MGLLYDDLFAQHRVAEKLLAEFSRQLTELETAGPSPELIAAMSATHTLLAKDAGHHFREEEEALFPPLAEKVGNGPDSILGPFLEDHKVFWQDMAVAEKALAALKDGRGEAADALRSAVGAILVLMPDHIEREDNLLFPMAREVLSADDWRAAERARP